MAEYFARITDEQAELIRNAPMFFIGSADPGLAWGPSGTGPVNLSPKGGTPLHIVSPTRVAYLDFPGSGNETARHATAGGPVTIMVCSFEREDAAIVRLFGKATVTPAADSPLAAELHARSTIATRTPRQVVEIEVERTLTSCGYGVPVMHFDHSREIAERGRKYKPPR